MIFTYFFVFVFIHHLYFCLLFYFYVTYILSLFLFLFLFLFLQMSNDFPEGDIDDMRAQMDATLLRYIAAAERKELMSDKMGSTGVVKREGREEKDRGEDEDDEGKRSKDRGERGEKERKRSSSRKTAV